MNHSRQGSVFTATTVLALIAIGSMAGARAAETDQSNWNTHVLPVLENRCMVCHGCFDAPCQLKLSSFQGLARGASSEKVYDGARVRAMEPTRLFIDASSTDEWRAKGFHSVMEGSADAPDYNGSVLYRLLRLKEAHPQPQSGRLSDDVTLDLDRAEFCARPETIDDYERENPGWGMPYGMPNLSEHELASLMDWLAAGGLAPPIVMPSEAASAQIVLWEEFLNGPDPKQRLMSRYLYEHLFLAHIYFSPGDEREFFRLVRSRTAPGEPVDEIPTVRPYDDPGTASFWYRLTPYPASIVAKDHLPYAFSDERMRRYQALFLEPGYEVETLPSYDPETASNPLLTFADIPADSRYRFMLDESKFFIEGFMKGPVCRGQVALNVIDDHFWVFFIDPDQSEFGDKDEFIRDNADYLSLPADRENTLNVISIWTQYWRNQKKYMAAKQEWFEDIHATDIDQAMEWIWDGDGFNPNASLTAFRHFDSASVMHGLVGDYPRTAWIIDFSLFERIHYLLVAGFDVYGNVGHQLNTRLFMDFLRMEGEDHFLGFLPASQRKEIRDQWYRGIRARRARLFKEPMDWLSVESVIGYETDDPQRELYQHLERRLDTVAGPPDTVNRCWGVDCIEAADMDVSRVEEAMRRLSSLKGDTLQYMPDVAMVRVGFDSGAHPDRVYTLVLNKGYSNLTSMFQDEDRRSRSDDTLTVVRGITGTYPNFFFTVSAADINDFTSSYVAIRSPEQLNRFTERYGLRRTDPAFWAGADWFQATYRELEPVEAGVLDLSRYENR